MSHVPVPRRASIVAALSSVRLFISLHCRLVRQKRLALIDPVGTINLQIFLSASGVVAATAGRDGSGAVIAASSESNA
jgi:hypothetical protein